MAIHGFEMDTPFGPVPATWERKGRMISVRYGERKKSAVASDNDATNLLVARQIVRDWIAADLKDG